jgi:predicted RNase H-like HicB family nuclease
MSKRILRIEQADDGTYSVYFGSSEKIATDGHGPLSALLAVAEVLLPRTEHNIHRLKVMNEDAKRE